MRAKGDIRQVILCVKITHKELEFSKVDDLLLIDDEFGKDFSQRYRMPKICSFKNLWLLKCLKNC